jgi:methylamine---corrinoid protein Co-methyltransferase
MLSIFESLKRADDGPYIKESDYDMKLFRTCQKLVKDYGIKYDSEKIVVGDEKMADAVFEAGLKLAVEMGMFHVDTNRIIEVSEAELRLAFKVAPKEMTLGLGRDSRVLRARTFDDGYPMTVCSGCPGTPLTEELFLPVMMSYAKEPLIDILIPGSLTSVDGMDVKTGGPLEIRATRQEMLWVREALDRAGRPGMHIYAAGESSATELGTLAICNDRYMRTSDSHMIPVLSELKTDDIRMSRVMAGWEYPAFTTSLIDPIIGGFGGGPEGASLVLTAAILLSTAVYNVDMHCLHSIHNKYVAVSTKEGMWLNSVVGRAFGQNAPLALLADAWTMAGAGTEDILYEAAALAIEQESSCLHTDSLGATNGVYPNCSGLEGRFFAEVVHAVHAAKMTFEEANELLLKIWKKYEHTFDNPDFGKPFDEVYDVKKIVPKQFWLDMYHKVKDDVASMGLEFIT